ncbi:MAG: hypothetical protein GX422_04085 [Deltaproteobacteria bacterium]|nr:hypothetical protein [Deltaproteobacteria bacterium]
MHGRSCRVYQGDLSGETLLFIALRVATKSRPGRRQSVTSSLEAVE